MNVVDTHLNSQLSFTIGQVTSSKNMLEMEYATRDELLLRYKETTVDALIASKRAKGEYRRLLISNVHIACTVRCLVL